MRAFGLALLLGPSVDSGRGYMTVSVEVDAYLTFENRTRGRGASLSNCGNPGRNIIALPPREAAPLNAV